MVKCLETQLNRQELSTTYVVWQPNLRNYQVKDWSAIYKRLNDIYEYILTNYQSVQESHNFNPENVRMQIEDQISKTFSELTEVSEAEALLKVREDDYNFFERVEFDFQGYNDRV